MLSCTWVQRIVVITLLFLLGSSFGILSEWLALKSDTQFVHARPKHALHACWNYECSACMLVTWHAIMSAHQFLVKAYRSSTM